METERTSGRTENMTKYYLLGEDSHGNWAIFAEDFWHWNLHYKFGGSTSTLENALVYPSANSSFNPTIEGFNRVKRKLLNGGLTYKSAVASLRAVSDFQKNDLREIKKKYRNSHKVTFTIISRNKALIIIKAMSVNSHWHYKEPKQCKRTSIEYRRLLKHYHNTNIYK